MTTVICGGCGEEVASEYMRTTNLLKQTLCPRCYALELRAEEFCKLEHELLRKEDELGEAYSAVTSAEETVKRRQEYAEKIRKEYREIERKLAEFNWEMEVAAR